MVATLEKGVGDVVLVTNEEKLEAENKTVLRGAADAIEGKISNAGIELYAKILNDMVYP